MILTKSKIKFMVFGLILLLNLSFNAYADDLNGININLEVEKQEDINSTKATIKLPPLPTVSEEKQRETENTAKAIGDMFSKTGIDQESIEQADAFLEPFARILNKIMAVILGVTSLLMMFITILDLLYMAFPPVRDLLDGGMNGPNQMMQGRASRGMGSFGGMRSGHAMQGMGSMSGSMGMGGQQQPQSHGGGLSAIGRWVSDEAIAACIETRGGSMSSIQGMPASNSVKSMLFSYMKKRSMFLILFGVCVVLFTSTVFTDLGIKIGLWGLRIIMGLGG